MPYLILVIGILIGLYALYRFFINANVHQVKALFLSVAAIAMGVALLVLALTGRLPAAIAIIAATSPFALQYLRAKHKKDKDIIDVTPIDDDEDEND